MPPGEIHVWLAFDEQFAQPELMGEFTALLAPDETARLRRLPRQPQRHQFLVTRALQRSVLADYLQAAPQELCFTPGEYGKPALAGPFDRAGLHFNIAHTRGLVALAISRAQTLGIDVENIVARTAPLALATRYFTAEEASGLGALPLEQQQRRFYALWTLKESWLKATGRGLAAGLANVSFSLDPEHLARSVTLRQEPACGWRFWQAAPTPEHVLALALQGVAANPVVRVRGWRDRGSRDFIALPVASGQEQGAQA